MALPHAGFEGSSSSSSSSSSNSSSRSSSLLHLPQEVLLQVLRKLTPQDRIGNCAATCRALLAAARHATQEVQLCRDAVSQQQADALVAWLAKHRSSLLRHLLLRSECIDGGPVTLHMPWQRLSQLTSLSLQGVSMEWPTCSSSVSSSSSWRGLSQLSLLQRLHLDQLHSTESNAMTGAAYTAALGSALTQLVQLTELSLSAASPWLGGAVLAGASNLSRLKSLELKNIGSPVQFQRLPSSLTSLELLNVIVTTTSGSSSSSGSSWQLPELQQLLVQDCELHVETLPQMPQLQHLTWDEKITEGSFDLLEITLPHLQQLQTLYLAYIYYSAGPAAFSAMTASSNLTSLVLVSCDVPAGAARHMFGAGRLLPHLQQLNITHNELQPGALSDGARDALDTIKDWSLLVEAGDVQRIVDSCPALQSLGTLRVAGGSDDELLPLSQLSALTELSLSGIGWGHTVDATDVLAKMTGAQKHPQRSGCGCGKYDHVVLTS
jgi:hypothetical protein